MDKIRQNVFPIITALIWGTAFSAQSQCAAAGMQAFTFNMLRSIISCLILMLVIVIFSKGSKKIQQQLKNKTYRKDLLWGGLCCGLLLAVASNLQQLGLGGTESGKGGFITALYIVLVPVLGLAAGKRAGARLWASVALAVAGLYCLCITEDFTISGGDFYVLLCAFCFSARL